jgi:uncharacterized Ntn-hydrolase superfamily protein
MVTYLIVTCDSEIGPTGVARHMAMSAAGADVPWARAGLGAATARAIEAAACGPRCLGAIPR